MFTQTTACLLSEHTTFNRWVWTNSDHALENGLSSSCRCVFGAHGSAARDNYSVLQHRPHQRGSGLAAALDSAEFHLLLLGGLELLTQLLDLGLVIALDHAERGI